MTASGKGDHLCVLVHGLWGNPSHLHYLNDALRSRHDNSVLQTLICERNAGQNTYDGVETGGERVAREIETALEDYARGGIEIRKLSIVGYSLGGLVSRYAIGLLYSKGYFAKIKPVNFTTFATPHLGVRTPLVGWYNHIWNVLGARTLSASGRQLFMIDKFRDTDRPLLSVLADKNSVFYKGLEKFSNKVLYANIVNDRPTIFYTAGISCFDPFADLSAVTVNYLPKYAPIVVDPENPVRPASPKSESVAVSYQIGLSGKTITKLPVVLIYAIVIPIGVILFLVNALFQTALSLRRIRLHSNEKESRRYHALPLLVDGFQEAADQVMEEMHSEIRPQHLPLGLEEQSVGDSSDSDGWLTDSMVGINKNTVLSVPDSPRPGSVRSILSVDSDKSITQRGDAVSKQKMEFPTLALAPAQFKMIHNLDALGFRKFPVWIHNDKHTHAAIIVRKPNAERWKEGKVVVSHWLNEAFEV